MSGFVLPILIFILMLVFNIFPKKEINGVYGYRTPSSPKNLENWREATKYWGEINAKIFKYNIDFMLNSCIF